jgi:ParB-like chromosome segregation protein Spo0J
MKISEIKIGQRTRNDMGDLRALADSMAKALIHPPTVDRDGNLIAGQRRIAAAQLLGWTEIPVTICTTLKDALQKLAAERDENICRKDFTPSEAVAMGERLWAMEKPKAEERQAIAGPSEGKGKKKSGSGKLPEAVKSDTRDIVGAAVGMSGKTYEKARTVVEAAAKDKMREEAIQVAAVAVAIVECLNRDKWDWPIAAPLKGEGK